jgi:DNA (cytosine-5)-methyltransferase 1
MKLLDLFCGAGGAAMGYYRAGFTEIVGIDVKPQPRYQFRFIQADALNPPVRLEDFDAIHASPPCQAHTTMSNRWRGAGGLADERVDLIDATRRMVQASGVPYVLENVPGARKQMRHPFTLNGGMFGLGVNRPRLFECSVLLLAPTTEPVTNPVGVYGREPDGRRLWTRVDGSEQRAASTVAEAAKAMGIDWMDWRELAESIPPAYTEFIGRQLIQQFRERVA